MSGVSFPGVMADYKESRYVSRPEALDPARYYELTPERRKLQEERVAIRAGLRRQYQLQLNDPRRKGLVVGYGGEGGQRTGHMVGTTQNMTWWAEDRA